VVQAIYDIVKAHGGAPIIIGMKVETPPAGPAYRTGRRAGKESEGAEFTVNLPHPSKQNE